jgi:hypothetical protein
MTCKMCIERGKTWEGSDPKCAFDGRFADNWNCATLNAIRALPQYEDIQHCDDQKYVTISLDGMDLPWLALWLTWYKNRGRTDNAVLLGYEHESRLPTEEECLAIIAHFGKSPTPGASS